MEVAVAVVDGRLNDDDDAVDDDDWQKDERGNDQSNQQPCRNDIGGWKMQ